MGETKRKRTKNTTPEQYELYLEAMENDYTFRSNTFNPTLPPNYLEERWKDLTLKLNSVGNGPSLTVEEWKKRFMDWKYATKAKCRKIKTHRSRTGGGPTSEVNLSALENRALDVWGRVTVDGAKNVTAYEGIKLHDEVDENQFDLLAEIIVPSAECSNSEIHDVEKNIIEEVVVDEEIPSKTPSSVQHRVRVRQKPLSAIAQNSVKITEENVNKQNDYVAVLENFTKKYLELEQKKLEFEIKKFKFFHPDFQE